MLFLYPNQLAFLDGLLLLPESDLVEEDGLAAAILVRSWLET